MITDDERALLSRRACAGIRAATWVILAMCGLAGWAAIGTLALTIWRAF